MGRDRSLDEFLSGGSDASAASDADAGDADSASIDADANDAEAESNAADAGPESDADGADLKSDADAGPESNADEASESASKPESAAAGREDVEPAPVTYRWEPDGVRCAACGATVDRLWSGDAGQVCAECKEW